MLTKDDRQAKSILTALHDLTSALQGHGISSQQISRPDEHVPKALSFLGSVKDSLEALTYESKTQAEETRAFQRQSLRIQWFLFFATVAAFVAVGIFANIARLQKMTMDVTLGHVQKQIVAAEV